jgi:hypothetical protein
VNEIIFARLTRSLQRRFGWCLRAIFKDMGSYSACLASTSRYDLTSSQMVIISISSGGIWFGIWFVCPETPGTPETHTKNNVSARKRISRSNSFYQYPTYSPRRPSPAGGYERQDLRRRSRRTENGAEGKGPYLALGVVSSRIVSFFAPSTNSRFGVLWEPRF